MAGRAHATLGRRRMRCCHAQSLASGGPETVTCAREGRQVLVQSVAVA